jgi:hypothetical protein
MNLSELYPGIVHLFLSDPTTPVVLMSNSVRQISDPTGYIIHQGILQIFITIQQFILVISMRHYHAKLVLKSDMATPLRRCRRSHLGKGDVYPSAVRYRTKALLLILVSVSQIRSPSSQQSGWVVHGSLRGSRYHMH